VSEMMRGQKFILIHICLLLITLIAVPLAWAETPGQIVIHTIDKGLKILSDPSLQDFDKMPERRQKLWDAVKSVFSFEETAKLALGRYWNDRTAEERKEFTETFKNMLKNIYLEKSDEYSQENIVYLSEIVKGNRSKVYTKLITSDGKEIDAVFSMKIIHNEWKIYDVTVEGVSIVGNYRSQFNSVLSKSSFEDLMEKLREKEKKLEIGS